MTNEAAERLLQWLDMHPSRVAIEAVNEALAAERRATVERIRMEVRLSAFAANARSKGPAYEEVISILDAEAV